MKMFLGSLATLCVLIGSGGIALGVTGYPLHASCKVEWYLLTFIIHSNSLIYCVYLGHLAFPVKQFMKL